MKSKNIILLVFFCQFLNLGNKINAQDLLNKVFIVNEFNFPSYEIDKMSYETTPYLVKDKFLKIKKGVLNQNFGDSLSEIIFKKNVNDSVSIYIYETKNTFFNYFHFLAYNSKTENISKRVIKINYLDFEESDFDSSFFSKPYFYIEYTHSDLLLWIKERHHNGTGYNAVILYCYKINDDMSFYHLFNTEIKVKLYEYSENKSTIESYIIRREIYKNKVIVYLVGDDIIPLIIGEYLINISKSSIENLKVYDFNYKNKIVTILDIDNKDFIQTDSLQ